MRYEAKKNVWVGLTRTYLQMNLEIADNWGLYTKIWKEEEQRWGYKKYTQGSTGKGFVYQW